jgi:hypothetical protein
MKGLIKMNDAKEMNRMAQIMEENSRKSPRAKRNHNNHTKPVIESAVLGTLPCSVDQVYSLGVRIQYYVGDIYLELERLNKGSSKNQFKNLALKQLDAKDQIEELAKMNLNRLLTHFYNAGGPIIVPPISERMAQEIQPFFTRISANCLKQLDAIVWMVSKGSFSASELEFTINDHINDMYTTLSMLFPVDEIKDAFNDLMRIRCPFCQD